MDPTAFIIIAAIFFGAAILTFLARKAYSKPALLVIGGVIAASGAACIIGLSVAQGWDTLIYLVALVCGVAPAAAGFAGGFIAGVIARPTKIA